MPQYTMKMCREDIVNDELFVVKYLAMVCLSPKG